MVGISLAGWDRLGWRGGPAEWWMRIRDRRATMAALVLCAAYLALLLWVLRLAVGLILPMPALPTSPLLDALLVANLFLMGWRIAMRALFVGRFYGWRQGVGAIPRTFVANIIAILAARRAIFLYARSLLGAPLQWDKTQHRFPEMQPDA
jgi:adsorption protein B